MSNGLKLLQTWFGRVWKEEDSTAIDEMFPSTGEAQGLGGQLLLGPQDFKKFHRALCGLICDIDIEIDKSYEEGEWISAICTLRATSKTNGNQVTITGSVFGRISEGKIQEAYNHWDFMGLWSQLGLLPDDCFEQGLMGHKIAIPAKAVSTFLRF